MSSPEEPSTGSFSPRLLASTSPDTHPLTTYLNGFLQPNSPRPLHLSADGSLLLAHSEDLKLRSFVLPPDLLSSPTALSLKPYSTSTPLKTHTQAIAPYFSLADPSTTHVLLSVPDLPLRLTNALDFSHTHATYPLIHAPTEAYIAPHSLAFIDDGRRFVAGSKARISAFDVARDGSGPVASMHTGRGGSGTGLKGLVTALDVCEEAGVLAAGSTSGEVAVYAAKGLGEEVMSFAVGGGKGVSQVRWAGSGRYLLVAQRGSDGMSVWDVRMGNRLALLQGRNAHLPMRMGFDVHETESRLDVWAGGIDGTVRIWRDVTSGCETLSCSESFKAHEDAVSSVVLHPCGGVAVTAAGSRDDIPSAAWEDADDGDSDTVKGKVVPEIESGAGIRVWSYEHYS